MLRCLTVCGLVAILVAPVPSHAKGGDASTLYRLEVSHAPGELKVGGEGVLVLELRPGEGAYLSPATPFSLELEVEGLRARTTRLRLEDAKQGPASTPPHPNARFEIPLVAERAGKGRVTAVVTFFICTPTLCERQVRTMSVPISIR